GILCPVVGVMGTLQALEAIKLLSGIATERNTLRLFDARPSGWRHRVLNRASHCPVCGGRNAHAV
ncbi:molybdopterin biosynthesis protein MoeB, partial [Enterobacter hormaechei]